MSGLIDFVDGAARLIEFGDFLHYAKHGVVAVFLPFGELSIDGNGTTQVGGIVLQLAAYVEEQQVAIIQETLVL